MGLIRNPRYIGGSDVAAVCGISDWATPIQVYCRLTHRPVPGYGDLENNEPIYWGRMLEPAILQSMADDLGIKFERNMFINHPDKPFVISPDGFSKENAFYAEVKNIAFQKRAKYGQEGTEEIEKQYLMQVQHGLGVMRSAGYNNINQCHFRALFGGQKKVDYFIKYDPEFIKIMWEILDDFLENHIKPEVPPEPDHSKAYLEFLMNEYDFPDPDSKTYGKSTSEIDNKILEREQIIGRIKAMESDKQKLTNEVCAEIKSDYGLESDIGKFLWYPVSGRVKESAVIVELMQKYNITESEIEALREKHRGDDFRVPRFYPRRGKK